MGNFLLRVVSEIPAMFASQSKGASQHVLQSSNERWSKVVKEHADKQSTSAATAASTSFCNVPKIVFA